MTGNLIVSDGKEIVLDRTFSSSPTRTAPSQFQVGTGITDPTISDTDLETPVLINGGFFKNFITGYPVLDFVNIQSTIRALLLSTEANGNSLTELGIFNSDGTPLLFSRATHTLIDKSTSIEVAYISKDKVS